MRPTAAAMSRFDGKVCVVTGSTAGIGLACCERFLKEGGVVVVSSRKQRNVDAAVAKLRREYGAGRVSGLACHVGKPADRKALVDHAVATHRRIDVLVLNAAASPPQPGVLDTPDALLDKVLEINVRAQLGLAQLAAPHLADGGSVCLVSSVGGYMPGAPHPAYGISKTAVFGLTRALAAELAPRVRCNCVAPGMVRTAFSKPLWANPGIEKKVTSSTLLKRLGEPAEIAGCVAFLSSADAGYATGEVLAAGGGPAPRI